jgi:2-haloacid dehalogenase
MQNIKGLFFDVGGTVFDWKNTVRKNIQKLAEEKNEVIHSEAFAMAWREEMFNIHSQVRQGNLPWLNSDDMHLRALDHMAVDFPLLKRIDREQLVKLTWHRLCAFTGAAQAINRLRQRYTVVVLTILSWESIVSSSKAAGVQWDGILSCEFLGYTKPSLEAYRKGTRLLGLKPSEAMMVAAHESDLVAARSAGMHTALVTVPEEDAVFKEVEAPGEFRFDIEAHDFDALCNELGV